MNRFIIEKGYILITTKEYEEQYAEKIQRFNEGLVVQDCRSQDEAICFKDEHEARCWALIINKSYSDRGVEDIRYTVGRLTLTVEYLEETPCISGQ